MARFLYRVPKQDDEPNPPIRLKDWRIKPGDIPGLGAVKPLLAAGKATRRALIDLLPDPLERAIEGTGKAVERVAVKPAVPSKLIESLPGGESKQLGQMKRDVELGIPSLLALNPLVDFGIKPEAIREARKDAPPVSLSGALGGLNEIAGPTIADIALGGAPMALGLALKGGEKIAKAGRMAKTGAEATEAAVKALRPESEAARSAFKAAIASGEDKAAAVKAARRAAAGLKPPEIPPEAPKIVRDMGGEGAAKVDPYFTTTDKVLRDAAGKRFVPKEAAEGLANAFRNTTRDEVRLSNEGATGLQGSIDYLNSIGDKSLRIGAKKRVAEYLDTGRTTGDARLDKVGDDLRTWLTQRFDATALEMARQYDPGVVDVNDAVKLLDEKGIKLNRRQSYLPHVNNRLQDVMKEYGQSEQRGLAKLKELYTASNEAPPPDEDLLGLLAQIQADRLDAPGSTHQAVQSVAKNIERERTFDVPGHIADYRRADFGDKDLDRALHAYNEQSAFRIADARHAGPQGEKYVAAFDAISDPKLQAFVKELRGRMVSQSGIDPLTRDLGGGLAMLRQFHAANKLGTAAIANSTQALVTSLPKSFQGVGTVRAMQNALETMGVYARELVRPGETTRQAVEAGAVYDRMLKDLAGVHERGALAGFANAVMTGTGFNRFERTNNVASFHLGRLWADDLAAEIEKGGGRAAEAEESLRKILETDPEKANEAVTIAKNGLPLPDDLKADIGYEFARTTQFRGDPTMLPLKWTSPVGKTAMQFKSFGFNYSRFVKDDIVKYGLRTGDWRPALTWVGTGMVSGEGVKLMKGIARGEYAAEDVQDALRDDIENLQGVPAEIRMALEDEIGFGSVAALLEATTPVTSPMSYAGGLGTAGDIAADVFGGRPERFFESLTPSAGDAADLIAALPRLDERGPRLLAEKLPIGPFARPLGRVLEGEDLPALEPITDLLDRFKREETEPLPAPSTPKRGRFVYRVP